VTIAIWCFNGFFQAMLWPPVTRTLTENLGESAAREAIAKVIQAAQIATLGIYILSPLAIRLASWRTVFLGASIIGFVAVALWYPSTANIRQHRPAPAQNQPQTPAVERAPVGRLVMAAGLIPMMIAIVLMGMLRDGLQTWMPTYICEVFGLTTGTSILISGLLPVLSVVSISAAMVLFRKVRNEVLSGAILFGVGTVAAVIMLFIFPGNAILGVSLFALLAGCMHGVNQMIVCSLPLHFEHYGRVATFAGLLNSFVYVGAAISTYGFASFSERFGWRTTMMFWMSIALFGTLICLFCFRKWKAFCKENP
jgi:OPA family glycerol-3-phosphate transporter-like MFS transporter